MASSWSMQLKAIVQSTQVTQCLQEPQQTKNNVTKVSQKCAKRVPVLWNFFMKFRFFLVMASLRSLLHCNNWTATIALENCTAYCLHCKYIYHKQSNATAHCLHCKYIYHKQSNASTHVGANPSMSLGHAKLALLMQFFKISCVIQQNFEILKSFIDVF